MTNRAWTAAGVLATAVGVTATLAPARLLQAFGAGPLTGPGDLGWRMFGIRTALIGVGVVADVGPSRQVVVPVQLADQVVFARALRTGDVPPGTALACMATSAVLIALAAAGRRA